MWVFIPVFLWASTATSPPIPLCSAPAPSEYRFSGIPAHPETRPHCRTTPGQCSSVNKTLKYYQFFNGDYIHTYICVQGPTIASIKIFKMPIYKQLHFFAKEGVHTHTHTKISEGAWLMWYRRQDRWVMKGEEGKMPATYLTTTLVAPQIETSCWD